MSGNIENGREMCARGEQEMNDAVASQPDNVAVLIPRGSVFLSPALHVPSPDIAKRDSQIAAADYEKTAVADALFRKNIHARER